MKQESEYQNNNILGVLVGMLIGSLAGALTMLLIAPQSGKKTRLLIQEKGIELREQTNEMLDDALSQARLDGRRLSREGRHKAKQLLNQSQTMVAEQLVNVAEAVKAGKKALLSS
jgi:gas vesicle protein